MMLTSTGVITMATIRSPIGCGVDSRVAWNSASTQLLTYNRDIKNGFSTWTLFRLQSILWHLGKGASCRQSQPLNDNCQARMHGSTQFDFDSRGKLTLIKPPELHLDPNQKSPGLNLFTGIQAADYSFANKEWTTLWRRSRQNKSTSSDQWLNRIGIISSTLHWTKEPFGLKRKPREPCTHELLQQKPTGWKPKPANNSVFIGLPEEI